MTTEGAALDKCHNAGVNEGFEAWRQFVMEWEPTLRTRFVGILMNVLSYRFRDDIQNKLGGVRVARTRLREPVKKDRRRRHQDRRGRCWGWKTCESKSTSSRTARITSWTQRREEILDITWTQQYTDSQPVPMQLGANPKSNGKGKNGKEKGKGKGVKGKGKDGKTESSKKAKSDDQRKCVYFNKSGHAKASEEPPLHAGELNHALSQAGGPTKSQLSRFMSSTHHISMEHRLWRKHLLSNPDTNARKENKTFFFKKKKQDPRKRKRRKKKAGTKKEKRP